MNNQPTDIRDQAEDLLLAHGTIPTPELFDGVEHLAETRGFEIAGDMLASLVSKLDIRQRALWTGLLSTSNPLAEVAPSLGVTAQALHRQRQRLKKRLMPRTKSPSENSWNPRNQAILRSMIRIIATCIHAATLSASRS